MEIEVNALLDIFARDQNPIFVIYGNVPYFDRTAAEFRASLEQQGNDLYLPLDMGDARCPTHEDTIFEIIHQLADRCLPKIPEPDEANALSRSLSAFRKAGRDKIDSQPGTQLGRFAGFIEFVMLPRLQHLFNANRRNIIGLERFEEVLEWSPWIYNFILDCLLKNIKGGNLRFVLFVKNDSRPSLFYGSNQEGTREKITFWKFPDAEGGYLNYQ